MKFEVEISYKANLDIRHIYEYYVMNNFDLNYVKHLINGIVSLIKSLEYLPERYPRFELLKKETNVRYAIYKKYKIIYEKQNYRLVLFYGCSFSRFCTDSCAIEFECKT